MVIAEIPTQLFYHKQSARYLQLEAKHNSDVSDYVIYWDDILTQFPELLQVKHGSITISHARDRANNKVFPLCIQKQRNEEILEIELRGDEEGLKHKPKIGLGQFPALEEFPFASSSSSSSRSRPVTARPIPPNPNTNRFSVPMVDNRAILLAIEDMRNVVFRQAYQLSEFTIPRLFIVVPKNPVSSLHTLSTAIWGEQLTLHFLCEGGMYEDSGIQLDDRLKFHLAKHEGYDLVQPREFFQKYGRHLLNVLRILQVSAAVGGIILPVLSQASVAVPLDNMARRIEYTQQVFQSSITFTQDYLNQLGINQEILSNTSSPASMQLLEGADLRQLENFLRNNDNSNELGNLNRTCTPKGNVEWVCSDHYSPTSTTAVQHEANKTLEAFVNVHHGKYDKRKGKVSIKLVSENAQEFYMVLKKSIGIQELAIQLDWKVDYDEICDLESAIKFTNIFALELDLLNHPKPTFQAVNIHKRGDSLLRMMANHKLQSLTVKNMNGIFSRMMKVHSSMTMQIRTLNLADQLIEEKHLGKLQEVLKLCTSLSKLSIFIHSIDSTFAVIKKIPSCYNRLLELDLRQSDRSAAVRISFKGTPPGQVINNEHLVNEINSISLDTVDMKSTQLCTSPKIHQLILHCNRSQCQNIEAISTTFKNLFVELPELKVLGFRCPVFHFFHFYNIAMQSGMSSSLRALQFVDKSNNELTIFDLDQSEKLLASLPDISITRENILNHIEQESLVMLLSNFGWKIKKLTLDETFTFQLAKALAESSSSQDSLLSLETLTWDISGVTNREVFTAIFQWLQRHNTSKKPDIRITVRIDSHKFTPIVSMLENLVENSQLRGILYRYMTHFHIIGNQSNSVVRNLVSRCQQKAFSSLIDYSEENS
ncbi:hypothetical protein BGZ76_008035 [Entomortierella beljakovae]|nr:hypothetical protein BGZ76_008035 [Entomortierella beljakovae]